jgi:O-antigen/teichoic acid export membrane protein
VTHPLFKQAVLVSYKTVSDLVSKTAFFVILILAAHTLPTRTFGLFSLASTLGWVLSVATDFGLQLHLARLVSRAPDRTAVILRPMLRVRIALAASAIGLAAMAYLWLPPSEALPFAIIVSAYIFSSLVEFLNYAYRGLSRSDLESTLNMVQRLVTLVLAVILLEIVPGLGALAIALAVPPAGAFAYSIRLLTRLSTAAGAEVIDTTSDTILSRPVFMRDVFPIGLGIVLSALYFRIDLFLVEHWRGVEDVARYNAAFRLIDALRLFPAAVMAVMLPLVFRQPRTRLVWQVSTALTVFGLAVAGALHGEASRVLDLAYGSRYVPAAPAFQVLLLAFPLLSLNYALTHQLIGLDGQRTYAAICGCALLVNLVMNAALIPPLGITGAAWATLGTEGFLTIAWIVTLSVTRPVGAPSIDARAPDTSR